MGHRRGHMRPMARRPRKSNRLQQTGMRLTTREAYKTNVPQRLERRAHWTVAERLPAVRPAGRAESQRS